MSATGVGDSWVPPPAVLATSGIGSPQATQGGNAIRSSAGAVPRDYAPPGARGAL
jgi:hypothetical protein